MQFRQLKASAFCTVARPTSINGSKVSLLDMSNSSRSSHPARPVTITCYEMVDGFLKRLIEELKVESVALELETKPHDSTSTYRHEEGFPSASPSDPVFLRLLIKATIYFHCLGLLSGSI